MNYDDEIKTIYKIILWIELRVIAKLGNSNFPMIKMMFINILVKLRFLILSGAKQNSLHNK